MTDLIPLVLDMETFYDEKAGYSLKKMPTAQYVRDERFDVLGAGVRVGRGKPVWLEPDDLTAFLAQVPWEQTMMIAHNCVPADTEVLTPSGWESIAHVYPGQHIMQWASDSGGMKFASVRAITRGMTDTLYEWDTTFHAGAYTPDHRVYFQTPDTADRWRVETAAQVASRSPNNTYIPVSGTYLGGSADLTPAEARLMEACRADGSFQGRVSFRFALKKRRKIQRLLSLLDGLGVAYRLGERPDGTQLVFLYTSPILQRIAAFLTPEKRYTVRSVMSLSLAARCAVLDEMQYWDGHDKGCAPAFAWSCADSETVEAVQVMAHLSGWRFSGSWRRNNRGYGECLPHSIIFVATLRPTVRAKLVEPAKKTRGRTPVFCVTVPSGAFLVRRNGRVWVTGNCQFDGLVLTEYYGHRPRQYACTMFMLRWLISQGLLDPRMRTSLDAAAPLVGMEKGNLEQALAEGYLSEYATDDAAICGALYDKFWHLLPEDEQGYIDIHVRMAAEPVFDLDTETLRRLADADKALEGLFPLVRKDDTFAAALAALGVNPEYKTTAKGNMKLALAKTDRFMQSLENHPNELVRALADVRLKSRSTIMRSRAQRFLDVGAPLPAPIMYYGAHCVPGDAEVLTPGGWVQIMDWRGGDIAQWAEDNTVRFAPATPFHGPDVSIWVDCDAPFAPGRFTLGHTIPRYPNQTGAFAPCSAEVAATKSQTIIPVGGYLTPEGEELKDAQARVLVMIQADGYWDRDDVRVQVKKPRKIARARRLFAAAGLNARESDPPSQPGYVRFWIPRGECPQWLTSERKQLGPWVLGNPTAVATELVFWDGWTQGGKEYYATTNPDSAEWAQTACHLAGWSANITRKKDKREDRKLLYVVGIRKRCRAHIYSGHWRIRQWWGRTYCAQTTTGYWLMRYDGHIQVTGNTGRGSGLDKINVQNLPRKGGLRECIRASEGYKLIIVDSSQIEVRTEAWLAGQEDLLEDFRQGRDPYLSFAAYRYRESYDDLVARRKAGEAKAELMRTVSKAAVLALGFMQGAGGFEAYCETYSIPLGSGEAEQVVRAYRTKYTRHVALANQALLDIKNTGQQQVPNGTKLTYPELRIMADGTPEWRRPVIFAKSVNAGWGNIWRGAAVENLVQKVARDVVFWQGLQMHKAGLRVILMVHDEVVLLARDEDAEATLETALRWMQTPPPWAEGLPLGAEGHISDCYTK